MLTNKVKQDASGAVTTEQKMGKFKAVIEVEIDEERKVYEANKQRLFKELKQSLKALWNYKFPDSKETLSFKEEQLSSMEARIALE